jgi:EAL domain-containing protein (putative c-di-GMP-specific phosphodiesterase class I)
MSVNISAHNIQDRHFITALSFLMNAHQGLAKNIILEVTETQMMGDTHYALKNLWALSELGFNVAIDDFGTGYSNLGYLKQLPANELKIDKMFILNLEDDQQNQVLVQTAIQMAHNLGMSVVAEGVESERCFMLLKTMGCDLCQGYHFSRPVPANQFDLLFEAMIKT